MAIPISDIYVRLGDQNAVTEIKFVQGGWLSTGSLASIQAIDPTRVHDKQIAYSTDEGKFYIAAKTEQSSVFSPGPPPGVVVTPASLTWTELPIGFPYTGSAGITGSLVVDGPVSASLFSGSFYGDGSNLTGIDGFPYTGSAGITGSLDVVGPITASIFTINTGSAEPSYRTGQFYWNSTEETMNLDLTEGVTLQLGQEQHYHVINQTGGTINNGDVVYAAGVSSGVIAISKFIANDTISPNLALGVATNTIADSEYGYVTSFGRVRDIDTTDFSIGDVLWASTTTAGGFQNTRPNVPNHSVEVGFVTKVGETDGEIYAKTIHHDDADEIQFNPSASTLLATNVQNALEELDASKASVNSLSSNIYLYPTTGSSPIPGYFRMVTDITDSDYNATAVDVSTSAISGSSQFIAALASDQGVFVGNPGVINITTLGDIRRTAGSGTAKFYFEIYQSGSSGEVLVGTSDKTSAVESATYEQFNAAALLDSYNWLSSERIVIKYYAERVAGSSNPTYDLQFGGSSPIKTLLPVPLSVIPSDEASDILVDTTNFNGVLDSNDNTIQDVFDTLDDHSHTLQNITDTGNTTTDRIIIGNLTTDTNVLYTSQSRVGIGTVTPTTKLDIHGDALITGSLTVQGRVTAEEFHTEFVSASIVYQSGSTKFGDTSDDIHSFSGSLRITGSGVHYITDGNVGIGTDTPSTKFEVSTTSNTIVPLVTLHTNTGTNGSVAGSSIDFVASGNVAATGARIIGTRVADGAHMDLRFHTQRDQFAMIIDENQNVGIGTTNPTGSLEISRDSDDGTASPSLRLTNASPTLDDGAVVGTIEFNNEDNSGGDRHIAKIEGIANATDERSVELAFSPAQVGVTTEAMRIAKNGNVGIGTDNPSDKLDVHGIIALNSIAFISQSANIGYIGDIDGVDAITNLDINTADGSTRIFLDDSGNVGINTETPSATLHVSGGLRLETYGEGDKISNDIVYALGVDSNGNVLEIPQNTGANADVDTGTEVVDSFASGSFNAAFTNYYAKQGTNLRAGQLMSVWDDAGNVEYTDVSTNSLGDTSGVLMFASVNGGNIEIKTTVDTDNWTVKVNTTLL